MGLRSQECPKTSLQYLCHISREIWRLNLIFLLQINVKRFLQIAIGQIAFLIVQNCSFFMGIIFCSSVAQVWTFNTRGVYNFITKEVNIPVNLVPFFNEISFLFCHFLKSGVTNDLKEQKSQNYLFQTGQNFAAHKTLVWSIYVWRTTTATIFFKKE